MAEIRIWRFEMSVNREAGTENEAVWFHVVEFEVPNPANEYGKDDPPSTEYS